MTPFGQTGNHTAVRSRTGSRGGRLCQTSYLRNKLVSFALPSAVSCLMAVLLLAGNPSLYACDDGWTVPDPENNAGLVEDCRALLAIRDDLAGTGFLNWEFGLPIDRWGGIRVSGSPSRVRQMVVFGDDLSGSIPPGLGRLSQLQTLRILSRHLMGPIPPELGKLSQLQELLLFGNRLGSIPPELGQLSQLRVLGLAGNQLTGSIPPELGQLSQLRRLALASNQLTGSIPPELGQLSQLEAMALDHNQLTGPIPPELGQLSQLDDGLRLQNNQLTGPIPAELGQLSQLGGGLYLQNNQLTGPIPPELGQLSQLSRLYLQNNELTGPIPPELGQLSRLLELYLQNNQLTGSIPAELGQLSRLWRLHLQHNQLTGSFPSSLGQLSQLQEFSFRGNRLTGPVPSELDHLPDVYVLNLAAKWTTPEQIQVTWDDPGDPNADYEYRLVLRDENLNSTVTDWTEIEDPEATLVAGEEVTIEWTLTNLPSGVDVTAIHLRVSNENGTSRQASTGIEPLQVSEDERLPYCRSLWPGRARCTTTTVLPHVFMGPLGEGDARAEILMTNRSGYTPLRPGAALSPGHLRSSAGALRRRAARGEPVPDHFFPGSGADPDLDHGLGRTGRRSDFGLCPRSLLDHLVPGSGSLPRRRSDKRRYPRTLFRFRPVTTGVARKWGLSSLDRSLRPGAQSRVCLGDDRTEPCCAGRNPTPFPGLRSGGESHREPSQHGGHRHPDRFLSLELSGTHHPQDVPGGSGSGQQVPSLDHRHRRRPEGQQRAVE